MNFFITLFLLFLIPACYGGGGSGGGTSSNDTIFHTYLLTKYVLHVCQDLYYVIYTPIKKLILLKINITGNPIVWRGQPSQEAYRRIGHAMHQTTSLVPYLTVQLIEL